jgi:hypothetical protein
MKKFFFTLMALLICASANAQLISIKGTGTIKIQGALSPDDKDRAISEASMQAIERYFSEKGEAQAQVFDANEDKIKEKLEKLIKNPVVLNEQVTPDNRKYQVTIRAELNEAGLKNLIKSGTQVNNTSAGEKSNFVYLFMARQANSVKVFDDRVVKLSQQSVQSDLRQSAKQTGREGENIKAGSISTSTSKNIDIQSDSAVSVKNEIGGSRTSKAAEVGFQTLPMSSYKPAITSIFSQSGFSIGEADLVLSEADIKSIYRDYSSGNDISPTSMKSVYKTLKASKDHIKYFVIATIEVGLDSEDPSTGMRKVGAEISGRVISIEGGLPLEVASVPPVQQASLGADSTSARTAALKKGAEFASREIIAQLNNSGIK